MKAQKQNDPQKQARLDRFIQLQSDMKQSLTACPKGCQNWSYQKSVEFKKAVKECDKFLKLKPTDDPMSGIKIENQLAKVRRYYQ